MPRQYLLTIVLLAATAALAGCGAGGSGGVNSVASLPGPVAPAEPPPTTQNTRTPLPPTPATTSGTYQAFSTFRAADATNAQKVTLPDGREVYQGTEIVAPEQLAPKGAVSITVDAATRTYTLTAAVGPFQFPTDALPMTMSATSDLGYTRNNPTFGPPFGPSSDMTPQARAERGDLVSKTVSAGTTATGAPRVYTRFIALYNVGQMNGSPRYLSAADWGHVYQENASGVLTPGSVRPLQSVTGTMVFGPRTEAGDIPTSGSARYSLVTLVHFSNEDGGIPRPADLGTTLDVDFASRRLSAAYERTLFYESTEADEEGNVLVDEDGNPKVTERVDTAVRATGSTIVASDGGFDIALSGSGTIRTTRPDQSSIPDISIPVSGSLTGAFFGPQAAEVGGVAQLPHIGSDGTDFTTFTSLETFAGVRAAP